MTARQHALRLIDELGADLDDRSADRQELRLDVSTPAGVMFSATGCHLIAIDYATDRSAGWADLLADLLDGVEPCNQPECDTCLDR